VEPSIDVQLAVEADGGADEEELERLARSLRIELLELDVEDVSSVTEGPPPEGARAADLLAVGALLVRLARKPEALAALTRGIRAWLGGHGSRKVRMELDGDVLELSGASAADQERLVSAWIERHAKG
jgi:hypothetical protein